MLPHADDSSTRGGSTGPHISGGRLDEGLMPRPYHGGMTSLRSASNVAVNVTLLAFAAERRAAVDIDRKAAAPAADAPCSNRSMSPAHSSKSAAALAQDGTDRQTDRRTPYRYTDPSSANKEV